MSRQIGHLPLAIANAPKKAAKYSLVKHFEIKQKASFLLTIISYKLEYALTWKVYSQFLVFPAATVHYILLEAWPFSSLITSASFKMIEQINKTKKKKDKK